MRPDKYNSQLAQILGDNATWSSQDLDLPRLKMDFIYNFILFLCFIKVSGLILDSIYRFHCIIRYTNVVIPVYPVIVWYLYRFINKCYKTYLRNKVFCCRLMIHQSFVLSYSVKFFDNISRPKCLLKVVFKCFNDTILSSLVDMGLRLIPQKLNLKFTLFFLDMQLFTKYN